MLKYEFMRNALLISVLISILCPLIGVFLVLKRHSMMGDTLAHASLSGVAAGLLLDINPVLAAFAAASLMGILVEFLRSYFKKFADLILVIVLSLSVGTAITIISSGAVNTNVHGFLFGDVLTVTTYDLIAVLSLVALSLAVLLIFYNQLVFIAFDQEGAKVAGIKSGLINYIFAVLVAAAIAVSIQIVGVLVISAMIALPVATALLFNKGFKQTLFIAMAVSLIDIVSGIVISYYVNVAAGGITALVSVAVLFIVLAAKRVMAGIK